MKLEFLEFTEDNAREVCTWQYEGQYHLYSCPPWNKACELKWGITIEEKRKKEFKSVIDDNNNLSGYVRFRCDDKDNSVLVGLGLKPSLCGHGVGADLMQLIKDYCDKEYHGRKIVLEVRASNIRAQKCYAKAGFKKKSTYGLVTSIGYSDFIRMEYE